MQGRKKVQINGLIDAKELGELWRTDRRTICRYTKEGLPHQIIQGKAFYNLKKCQDWWARDWFETQSKMEDKP